MPDSSPGGTKKKITIVACQKGVEIAEKALIKLGFDSKSNFAQSQRLSRSVVTKFFNKQPIQLDSFKRICKALKLNWEEVARLQAEDRNSERIEDRRVEPIPSTRVKVESVQIITRVVVPVDEQGQEIKAAAVILEGDIKSVQTDLLFWCDVFSKKYPGSTIKVISIKPGSIKLIIEGTQEDIEILLSDFESGNLTEIAGFPVQDVQLLSESAEDEESSKQKWSLVEEIVTKAWRGRDLRGADLSDTDLRNTCLISANLSDVNLSNSDLSHADLSYADLSRADLSDANLSRADLSSADLIRADLSGANLIGVNLSNANLKRANLSGADLSGARVENAEFGASLGISESMKQDLIKRGAIFEDFQGDRSNFDDSSDISSKIGINTYQLRNTDFIINGIETNSGAIMGLFINKTQQQNLAEAAFEIQQLLEQLEKSYPTNTTEGKMRLATEAISQIEHNSALMIRIISVLEALGASVFEEVIDHAAASSFIAALAKWRKIKGI